MLHHSIYKYTVNSDGKTHNPIDHILIDESRHLRVTDFNSFSGVDCRTIQ